MFITKYRYVPSVDEPGSSLSQGVCHPLREVDIQIREGYAMNESIPDHPSVSSCSENADAYYFLTSSHFFV